MFEVLRELNRKIDEVVGRQERTMSLIAAVQQGVAVPQHQQGQAHMPQHPPQMGRPEIDAILQNQNMILGVANELK